eukprot:7484864-Lingulodinium_polyedra.AAC.1
MAAVPASAMNELHAAKEITELTVARAVWAGIRVPPEAARGTADAKVSDAARVQLTGTTGA